MEFDHRDYDAVRLFDILCDVAVRQTHHRGFFGVEIKALVPDGTWASVADIDGLLQSQPETRLFLYSYWWGESGVEGEMKRHALIHEMRRGVRRIVRDLSRGWQQHDASTVVGLVYPPSFPLPASFFVRERAFLNCAGPSFDVKLEMEMWRRLFRIAGHIDTVPDMRVTRGKLNTEFYVWTPDGDAFIRDFVRTAREEQMDTRA